MPEIGNGAVKFDTVAREWRCKYTGPAGESKSLEAAQKLLEETLPTLKALPGVKEVKRAVCGGCMDFKVLTALEAGEFGAWEGKEFEPEKTFVEKLSAIEGISQVETQTMTYMTM